MMTGTSIKLGTHQTPWIRNDPLPLKKGKEKGREKGKCQKTEARTSHK